MKPSFARVTSFLPPLIWTAFLWLYIIVASRRGVPAFLRPREGQGSRDRPFRDFPVLYLVRPRPPSSGRRRIIGHAPCHARKELEAACVDADRLACFRGLPRRVRYHPVGRHRLAPGDLLRLRGDGRSAADIKDDGARNGKGTGLLRALRLGGLGCLALVSAGRWLSAGFDGSVPFSGPSWGTAYAGLQLIGVLDPILPQLALLFFFAWALRLVLSPLLRKARTSDGDRSAWEGALARSGLGWPGRGLSLLLLGIAVVLAAFVTICPYLPAVNPGSSLVGVDVYFCYSHVLDSTLLPSGAGPGAGACVGSAASYAVQRLGAVEMLKGLAYLSGSDNLALETAPAILAVLLAVSTYLLVLEERAGSSPRGSRPSFRPSLLR